MTITVTVETDSIEHLRTQFVEWLMSEAKRYKDQNSITNSKILIDRNDRIAQALIDSAVFWRDLVIIQVDGTKSC